jgi:acyl carrier protein
VRTKDEVVAWLSQVLVDQFDVKREAIVPQALLGDDLDLDSIDSIDFVVTLEEETGASVDEDELRGLRCFQDMVDLVCRKLATE